MIDERKQRILRAVVLDYIATAEPVGSRTIARKYGLGVSPATIRNEMADLEELGYLEQPHTSAGRVPSDRGYRFYVDRLMEPAPPSAEEIRRVRRSLARRLGEMGSLVRQTAQLLAETTHCLALVEGPRLEQARLRALQVVPLRAGKAVLLVITDEGLVENRLIDLPQDVSEAELAAVAQTVTGWLQGLPLGSIGRGLLQRLQVELARYRAVLDQLLEALHDEGEDEAFVLEGTTQIFTQPEFRDVERFRTLLATMAHPDAVERILGEPGQAQGVRITIGREHPEPNAHEWGTVTAVYRLGGHVAGRIAVIGPKRMDYGRVAGWVELVAESLSDFLHRAV